MAPDRKSMRVVLVGLLSSALVLLAMPSIGQDIFSTISSPNFEVRYLRGVSAEEAQKVLSFLQDEYKEINAQLGLEPRKRLEVRIYDNVGRYLSDAGLRKPWRGAFYSHGVIYCQPVQALTTRDIFESSLRYELGRAMTEVAGTQGCPLWLREAYVVYHTGEYRKFTAPLGARLTSFSDLNQDIQSYPDPPQRDDVHYMLGHTMNYFIQKYGEKKAFRIFREFDGTKGLDGVFKRVLGNDLATVEKGWAKYIGYHTTPFKR